MTEVIKKSDLSSVNSMISNITKILNPNDISTTDKNSIHQKKVAHESTDFINNSTTPNNSNQNYLDNIKNKINKFLTSPSFIMTINMILTVMFYSVGVRRGHDLNISVWITFILTLIPIINILVYGIYFASFKGTYGPNKYGS